MNLLEVNKEVLELYDQCKDYNEIKQKEDEYIQKELQEIQNRKNSKYGDYDLDLEDEKEEDDEDDVDNEDDGNNTNTATISFKNYSVDDFLGTK